MAGPVECPACGRPNNPTATFCISCGAAVARTDARRKPVAGRSFSRSPWEPLIYGRVSRTDRGLLLMVVSLLSAWIPVVAYLSWAVGLTGAILIVLGREGFGRPHERNVVFGLTVLVLAFLATFAVSVIFGGSISLDAAAGGTPAAVLRDFQDFLAAAVALSCFGGLAYVLMTLALLPKKGRLLLWVGYAAQVGVSVAVAAMILGQVGPAIAQSFASSPPDPAPVSAVRQNLQAYGLLDVIPYVLFAAAYLFAHVRIAKGDIPPREPVEGSPAAGAADAGPTTR